VEATSAGIVLPKDPTARIEEVERFTAATLQVLADDLSKGGSDNLHKLLAFFSRFHSYSARNKLLIMLQKPDASRVASYTKWKELDRQVKKGAKAIYVYGPVTRKEQDAVTGEMADRILGFRLLPVFDAADLIDIEERPLPSLWTPLPDDATPILNRFIERIKTEGVQVEYRKLKPGVQGFATAQGITLSSGIPDSRNRLATCIHEYLHHRFHFTDNESQRNTRQCEIEVESSAFVVMQQLGLAYPFSGDYLTTYAVTPEMVMQSLERINTMVQRVTKIIDPLKQLDHNQAA
jgi:hypothetical protein